MDWAKDTLAYLILLWRILIVNNLEEGSFNFNMLINHYGFDSKTKTCLPVWIHQLLDSVPNNS